MSQNSGLNEEKVIFYVMKILIYFHETLPMKDWI